MAGRRWTRVLTDVRPLRVSAPYRRLVRRQHDQPARPADDRGDRGGPGLRADGLVVRGRPAGDLRAGAAGRVRAVRRVDRRRRGPAAARHRRLVGVLGGVPGARGAGVPRQHPRLGDLPMHRGAGRVLRHLEPGPQRDDPAAAAHRPAAGGGCAQRRVVQPRLHRRAAARRGADLVGRVRGGVHRGRAHVHRHALRALPAARDAADPGQPAGGTALGASTGWVSCGARPTCG